MHFHRMLIFWLAGLARSFSCGSEDAVANGRDPRQDQQLIAAQNTARDAGTPPEPVPPQPEPRH